MAVQRPLSPHLTIYRKQISSVLSISHRISGLALYAGAMLVAAWLVIAAYMPEYYQTLYDLLASQPGRLCLLGWTLAFFYHLSNGIRHLFWDMGKGYSLPALHRSGWAVVFFAVTMTALTWGFISAHIVQDVL